MKILLSKPGLDGHDVGVKVLAHALKDAGFKVIYTGLRKSVEKILDMAVANQVDIIGLSILSGTHLIIADNIRKAMDERDLHFLWVIGGNIPAQDVNALMKLGPDMVFPTGTQLEEIIAYFSKIKEQKVKK
ncbi:cobalamin B12-binding domain-containing protein [Bacteroidota bacterium]